MPKPPNIKQIIPATGYKILTAQPDGHAFTQNVLGFALCETEFGHQAVFPIWADYLDVCEDLEYDLYPENFDAAVEIAKRENKTKNFLLYNGEFDFKIIKLGGKNT